MPCHPGEEVNLRFIGNPDNAVFYFMGQQYTVANGGLECKRKSALHPTVRLPKQPGKYAYTFETDGTVVAEGHLRVTAAETRKRTPVEQASPEPQGIKVRRLG